MLELYEGLFLVYRPYPGTPEELGQDVENLNPWYQKFIDILVLDPLPARIPPRSLLCLGEGGFEGIHDAGGRQIRIGKDLPNRDGASIKLTIILVIDCQLRPF